MQIILLSGGSGKRLWPLSNGTRSKQFLQLLQAPNGEKESMVQRVLRQIGEAIPDASVTVATSNVQRDSIENQLGARVNIVTEPERRDTFPAIALSAAYLAMECNVASDETVVVMPCDTFTEIGYFRTVASMAALAERNVADLVLMGISPTYPSTKFGYVVPETDKRSEHYMMVQRFTEKPCEETANELLAQGAFWNGGVFAFRLGYIMDIVEKYIATESFEELRARYEELPKISFDYEVAEKAKSVAVVPFSGKWKDLGTWNALVEELPVSTGNVVIGNDTEQTTVINELNIPIVCDGVSNIVVAAGYDGILICGKESSEQIKQYVEPIAGRPMFEERRWGTYRVIDESTYADGLHSLTKSITLNPGKCISYQTHSHRTEVWTFVEGEGIFVLDGKARRVKAGDAVVIPVGSYHTIKAVTQLTFIEVQMGNPLVEEDIQRYEWNWDNTNV